MDAEYGPLSAEFYDLTKPLDADYPDVPYYREELSDVRGRVLEIGAGTGRLLVPLLEAGIAIEGLEPSPHMLTYLRGHLKRRRLKCELQAIRAEDLREKNAFGAIVISFGSFQLFSEEQASQVLAACHRALAKNGRLYVDIDVIRPDTHRAGLLTQGARIPAGKDAELLLSGSRNWDFVSQHEQVFLRYERWQAGALEKTEIQSFNLRWYGVREFEARLKEAGFTEITLCGDYHQPELHAETGTICFRAKRG